jgi:hypothetical protein
MHPLTEVVAALPANLKHLHLTFVGPDGTSTFAADNARELHPWALVMAAKIHSGSIPWLALHKRQFTTLKDSATGRPVKRLSSALFNGGTIRKFSAAEARQAFYADAASPTTIRLASSRLRIGSCDPLSMESASALASLSWCRCRRCASG